MTNDSFSHHAYLHEGGLALLPELVKDARERFGFLEENNPDVSVREFEKFGIDESRELAREAALKSVSSKRLFVVGVSALTSESQQALLKLFEEPPAGVVFVLLVPHGTVLATLRSRTLPYPLFEGKETSFLKEAKHFIAASAKERSDQIAALLEDEEGAKERVRGFVVALEREFAPQISTPRAREALQDLAKTRSYVNDRSPSLKMLLEHLAISLPKL